MCSIKEALSSCFKENCIQRCEHQQRLIEAYVSGKDVFPSSPTQSGKSQAFEVTPYISDYARNNSFSSTNNSVETKAHESSRKLCTKVTSLDLVSCKQNKLIVLASCFASLALRGSIACFTHSPEHFMLGFFFFMTEHDLWQVYMVYFNSSCYKY